MAKRKIVDAHHHLWDLGRGYNYPWLQDRPLGSRRLRRRQRRSPGSICSTTIAPTRRARVVKSVHVEAVPRTRSPRRHGCKDLADKRGFPHAIVARAELNAPDVETGAGRAGRFANVRGIRHIVNWHSDPRLTFTSRSDLLTDPAWLAGFGLLEEVRAEFRPAALPQQMADAQALATAPSRYADRSSTTPACRSTATPTASRYGEAA